MNDGEASRMDHPAVPSKICPNVRIEFPYNAMHLYLCVYMCIYSYVYIYVCIETHKYCCIPDMKISEATGQHCVLFPPSHDPE